MIDSKAEKAYERGFEFEKNHHGCGQCVIGALYGVFPELSNENIFRSASGFGAGTGLTTKGQCGALSGAVMVLSQIHGRQLTEIADPERKRFVAYRFAENIVDKFMKQYGTVICGEIQTKLIGRSFYLYDPAEWDAFEAAGGHNRICPSVVANASRWAAELIIEGKK
jgi:C_GCAxxG_C_C family probable redox protein